MLRFSTPPLSGKSLTCGGFQTFVRPFFEGKKGWQDNITVMLNSFQHLMFACTDNKEIPKQYKMSQRGTSCANLYAVAVRNDNRGAAFTLAEVLITLVIIGVIAALTLPTLIGKYQKHQTVVGLKKAYSEVSNAVRMSVAENGDVSTWNTTVNEAWLNKYIIPYFKIVKTEEFSDVKRKVGTYYQISGQPETGLAIMNSGKAKAITLPSGAQVWLAYDIGNNSVKCGFYIDINGPKKPNTFGKDVFVVRLWKNNGKVVMDSTCDIDTAPVDRTVEELKARYTCYDYGCNKNGRGIWCGALIQAEGWEIKDDYPW